MSSMTVMNAGVMQQIKVFSGCECYFSSGRTSREQQKTQRAESAEERVVNRI